MVGIVVALQRCSARQERILSYLTGMLPAMSTCFLMAAAAHNSQHMSRRGGSGVLGLGITVHKPVSYSAPDQGEGGVAIFKCTHVCPDPTHLSFITHH